MFIINNNSSSLGTNGEADEDADGNVHSESLDKKHASYFDSH